jgi:RNA polymerase sigma-70 factor (ECF subfamily)
MPVPPLPVTRPSAQHDNLGVADEFLIQCIRHGDRDCFAPLMRRYNQRLFRVARAIVRNDEDAEDVVQQAYVAAFTHIHQYSGAAAFATWLTRIAINQALARLRDRARMRQLRASDSAQDWHSGTSSVGDPEEHAGRSELARMLEAAIEGLPASYRAIVVLRELEGLSTQEAAACLAITDDAARVRLHRARHLLRQELRHQLGALPAEVFPFGGQRCAGLIGRVLAALGGLPLSSAAPCY